MSMNAPFIPEGESRHRISSNHGYYRFQPYHVPTHSRGESSSTGTSDNRAPSPALSVASAQTSNSSHGPSSHLPIHPLLDVPVPSYTRVKYTKQRLYNIDRKKICVYAEDNPNLRQEDIARKFNIERSTVSKILKNKHRWLSIDDEPPLLIAKQRYLFAVFEHCVSNTVPYRQAKFPGIETLMEDWVVKSAKKNIILTDAMLRKQALEFGRELGFPPANFKASPGWVENFKARVGIKQGFYHGNGKRAMVPQSLGTLAIPPGYSMAHLPDPWGPDADMSLNPIERTAAAFAAQHGQPYPHAVSHTDPPSPRQEEERSRDESFTGDSQQLTSIPTTNVAHDSHWDRGHERSERRDGRDLERELADGGDPTDYTTHQQPFQDTEWEGQRALPPVGESPGISLPTTNAALAPNIVDEQTAGMPEVEQHIQALLTWMHDQDDFEDEYSHLVDIRTKILLHVRTAPSIM